MSRSEAVQPSAPQAREGYRHVAITLHCAIHETHDRTQTAKIVGSLAQAENALNSCGLPGPGSDPIGLKTLADIEGVVHCIYHAAHQALLAALSGQAIIPADAFSAGPRTTTTHVNEAGNA